MRAFLVFLFFGLLACATGGGGQATTGSDTRVSRVSLGEGFPRVIRVEAGMVHLTHVESNARLRATTLKGLNPANLHLEYRWTRNGTFRVEVSGRYEHGVAGAVISRGRLESHLTYRVLPDSLSGPE